jgi:hypothetical protein
MAFEMLQAVLPAQSAAGATSVTIVGAVPSSYDQPNYSVGKLSVTSPSLVTGQATNFATINVRQMRAGASVGTIGTLALSAASVTLPAEVETNIPVTGSPVLLDGDVLDVQLVQTGTGLALPAGIVAKVELF